MAFASRPNTEPSATEGGKGEYEHTGQALKFIEENKEKPFFLYVPYNTPHIPLAAKSELIAKHKDAFYPTYAAMMETMDDCVGLILKKIKDLGLDEKTLVIFTSDNGGLSVLDALRRRLPNARLIYLGDVAHAPYGDKDAAAVVQRCHRVVGQPLRGERGEP